jgi:hypothetical protein
MITLKRLFSPVCLFAILWTGFIVFAVLEVSCAKHAPLTPSQNIQLSTLQALDLIAHSNRAASQTVRQLNSSKVLSDSLAREIQEYNLEIDVAVQKAQAAASSGLTPAQRTAAIIAAFQPVKQLPAGAQAFIGNPGIQTELQNLATLVTNVVQLVQALQKGAA